MNMYILYVNPFCNEQYMSVHSHLRVQHGFLQPRNPLRPVSGNPLIAQCEETIKLLFCKTTLIEHFSKLTFTLHVHMHICYTVWPDQPLIPGRWCFMLVSYWNTHNLSGTPQTHVQTGVKT